MSDRIKAKLSRYLILRLIYDIPGIRFNDLARITKLNNGSLSYSIRVLDKKNLIKVYKSSNKRTTRYFSPSVNVDDFLILGFFKNQICKEIVLLLHYKDGNTRFDEIKNHIKKSDSTTSWYLKKLLDNHIILKSKNGRHHLYTIKYPSLISRILKAYTSLYPDKIVIICVSLVNDSDQILQLL